MLNIMKTAKYKCVVWDWNGTIVDDVNASLMSVNDMLIKRNMPVINLQQYHSYLDTPISKFYEHLFDLSVVTFDIIQKEFNIGYNKHIKTNPINVGATKIMQQLVDRGVYQVIVSSSHQSIVDEGARKFGIDKYMNRLSGSNAALVGSKV